MKQLSNLRFAGIAVLAVGLLSAACGGAASAGSGATPGDRTAASASGTKVVSLHDPLEALAMDGNRVAYDVSSDLSKQPNRVLVWNLATGKTTKVSGKATGGAESVTGGGVYQLAIAGTRVAWLIRYGSNEESGDDLYTSSVGSPKERHVQGVVRSGSQCGAGRSGYEPACAGTWLGGVVGSGSRLLVNRWTTDATGAVGNAALYALEGTKLSALATGPQYVQAVAADSKRVAVLQWQWLPRGRTIHLYSSTGRPLVSVTPNKQPEEIALGGNNLVVLTHNGKLFHYDARTGSLLGIITPHGKSQWVQALAVHGNIAVYSTAVRYYGGRGAPSASAIRAVNLSTGEDREIGRLPAQINVARIDSTGLVYANNLWSAKKGYVVKLVFVPFTQVAAAVS